MLKKLIVVYNPRSSKHAAVAQEVLEPARKLSGWLVGRYEVKATGLRENADELAKILNDGDLVIVAGGDGTAAMAVNGVMRSGKDVALGVLGYGNFNDLARMLKAKRAVEYGGEYVGGVTEIVGRYEAGKLREIYPLEAKVDGKHWRYAPCYLSLGLFAESTTVFDEPKVRDKLKTGKKHLLFSIWTLARWYFRNRKREFLPEGRIVAARDVLEVKAVESKKTGNEKKLTQKEDKKPQKKVKPEKKADTKLQQELKAAKTEKDAEQKKFKALLRAAKKQQLLEMKSGARMKMLKAGTQTKARLAVAKTETRAKLLDAKLKTQDKMSTLGKKAREKHIQSDVPEIIIEGAEVVEQRQKNKNKGSNKKNIACAVEKLGEKGNFSTGATDYIAVNSPRMAKMMRGGKYYRKPAEFRSTVVRLSSFWRLLGFMMRSVLLQVPGKRTRGDIIKFKQRANVMIQAEGEYEMLEGVKKIEVRKAKKGLKVVWM